MKTTANIPEHLRMENIIKAFNPEMSKKDVSDKVELINKNSYSIQTINCEDTWKK